MVQLELSRIIIDDSKHEQLIVLKEINSQKMIPVAIGFVEAEVIRMYLNKVKLSRPLTHDLLVSLLVSLHIKLEKLVIDELADDTFYAKLYLQEKSGALSIIDCRPSDGIVLALRMKAPIYIEQQVLDQMSNND
jgi:hypothetical protein